MNDLARRSERGKIYKSLTLSNGLGLLQEQLQVTDGNMVHLSLVVGQEQFLHWTLEPWQVPGMNLIGLDRLHGGASGVSLSNHGSINISQPIVPKRSISPVALL